MDLAIAWTNSLNIQVKYSLNQRRVCLTEHWLASQSPSFLKIRNYNEGSVTVDHIHGGVLILTMDTLESEEIFGIKELSVEMIVKMVAVRIPEKKIAILAVYRVPSGDFNVDFIEGSGKRNQLLNLIEPFGLHITTQEPFRLTKCIDNLITDISGDISETVTLLRSQVTSFCLLQENNHPKWIYRRSVTKNGINTLKKKMVSYNWKENLKMSQLSCQPQRCILTIELGREMLSTQKANGEKNC
ncbi:hypothetical protein HHI36_002136 [Cryptolaemus montrouzieri]|uniref:Uncharacterized protein n=1 Tax=Cryptolaemus montrouzieri TaxID=559131 RepID=A0ABD2P9Q1_9CUCU